jgi:hypothetical protein
MRERELAKTEGGGSKRAIVGDQQTVAHLRKPLGIASTKPSDAVEFRQLTVSHLAKPLGSAGSQSGAQSGPGEKPANQGSQGGADTK